MVLGETRVKMEIQGNRQARNLSFPPHLIQPKYFLKDNSERSLSHNQSSRCIMCTHFSEICHNMSLSCYLPIFLICYLFSCHTIHPNHRLLFSSPSSPLHHPSFPDPSSPLPQKKAGLSAEQGKIRVCINPGIKVWARESNGRKRVPKMGKNVRDTQTPTCLQKNTTF